MAPSQKATWARPNLAAMPTQVEPTTHSTCAMTRSPSPSSLRRPACSRVTVSDTVNNNATAQHYQSRRYSIFRTNVDHRERDMYQGTTSVVPSSLQAHVTY